jgi:hypothetical protein
MPLEYASAYRTGSVVIFADVAVTVAKLKTL